eukprot:Plantae.Rhodophyta-Palmaria_palmata.ctg4749.p1 GENE.Plantae.Rhodophyta-Palmaria_palmata.ctg4749~~Plantae.Rhodophyta-Palmaria_palmata.ctg4749.p1  ORF type:complete len:510 (+),score=135.23 Plantae.Rhodophyta-Palmaria_palmata.ctg4749:144-1532(+)
MFDFDLWRTSGHAANYKDSMFQLEVEGRAFGLKPMNCPSHCVLFASRVRSHRELPMRLADFGVLHRNEASGSLGGLTRVRRFQQDDAHIFCLKSQVRKEVFDFLNFLKHVYDIFGFNYTLKLSTRPEKYLGEIEQWDLAEEMLADALVAFTGKKCGEEEGWKLNPADGAFYGPKIDIEVFDALKRPHQCATLQLDFQLPNRFNLQVQSSRPQGVSDAPGPSEESKEAATAVAEVMGVDFMSEVERGETGAAPAAKKGEDMTEEEKKEAKKAVRLAKKLEVKKKKEAARAAEKAKAAGSAEASAEGVGCCSGGSTEPPVEMAPGGKLRLGFERPVIIHRAIYGSFERFIAILIEHYGGFWPFWLSPRQAIVVPVSEKSKEYGIKVQEQLRMGKFFVDIDQSDRTMSRKLVDARNNYYNAVLVVGEKEVANGTVNLKLRGEEAQVPTQVEDVLKMFEGWRAAYK